LAHLRAELDAAVATCREELGAAHEAATAAAAEEYRGDLAAAREHHAAEVGRAQEAGARERAALGDAHSLELREEVGRAGREALALQEAASRLQVELAHARAAIDATRAEVVAVAQAGTGRGRSSALRGLRSFLRVDLLPLACVAIQVWRRGQCGQLLRDVEEEREAGREEAAAAWAEVATLDAQLRVSRLTLTLTLTLIGCSAASLPPGGLAPRRGGGTGPHPPQPPRRSPLPRWLGPGGSGGRGHSGPRVAP
jgi:hypothetical protein